MYKKDFQDWGKGIKLVEGRPKVPYYPLKFNAKSHYKEQCEKSDQMWKDIKDQRTRDQANYSSSNLRSQMPGALATQMMDSLQSDSGIFGMSQKSFDKQYLVTSKHFDERPMKESIERASKGDFDFSVFRGNPIIRPKTALQGSLSVTGQLKQSPMLFQTSYKKNYVPFKQNGKPYHIPYP